MPSAFGGPDRSRAFERTREASTNSGIDGRWGIKQQIETESSTSLLQYTLTRCAEEGESAKARLLARNQQKDSCSPTIKVVVLHIIVAFIQRSLRSLLLFARCHSLVCLHLPILSQLPRLCFLLRSELRLSGTRAGKGEPLGLPLAKASESESGAKLTSDRFGLVRVGGNDLGMEGAGGVVGCGLVSNVAVKGRGKSAPEPARKETS